MYKVMEENFVIKWSNGGEEIPKDTWPLEVWAKIKKVLEEGLKDTEGDLV